MPEARTTDWPDGILTDEEAVYRLQEILLSNVEGQRDSELNGEYKRLRTAFRNNPEYGEIVPRLIRVHADLDGMWSYMKSVSPQWEPRRQHVREEMRPLFDQAETIASREVNHDPPWPGGTPTANPSDWTGTQSPRQRLAAARAMLPVAQASVNRLIEHLSQPNHNGAPPLDETEIALENLRGLHRTLGELLDAMEGGNWDAAIGQGLPQEAARYAKRAARALRDDPMPYAVSGLLLAIFSACGFPGVAGYLAGVALTIKKGKG